MPPPFFQLKLRRQSATRATLIARAIDKQALVLANYFTGSAAKPKPTGGRKWIQRRKASGLTMERMPSVWVCD